MIATVLLAVVGLPVYKCAVFMDPMVAISKDKKTKVVLLMEGKVLIYDNGKSKPKAVAKWERFGHHLQLILSPDASKIAIFDKYAGLEVLRGNGKRWEFYEPKEILNAEEIVDIPGKWACHEEGSWASKPDITFSSRGVAFTIYNGRHLNVLLPAVSTLSGARR
jgi:hypothetical protein